MLPEDQVAGVRATDGSSGIQDGVTDSQSIYSETVNGARNGLSTLEDAGATSADAGFTLASFFGLFNILVGLMLVAAFLLFFGGLIAYLTRLGMETRLQGLVYMYRGTTVLFVLVVLLAIVNFVQFHTSFVLGLIAVLIVLFGFFAVLRAFQASKGAVKEVE